MTNRNYVRGRSSEYAAMKILRNMGYIYTARSAASHGPMDVIAIGSERHNPDAGEAHLNPCVLLVQVKRGSARLDPKEREALKAMTKRLVEAGVCVGVQTWFFKPEKGKRINYVKPKMKVIHEDKLGLTYEYYREMLIEP